MRNFILRRLLQTIPMLLLASLLIFCIFALAPGDFIDGNINLTAQRAAELRALYGLDQRYDTHLRRLRRLLAQRQSAMRQAIAHHFPPTVKVSQPDGGYFLWLELNPALSSMELYRRALSRGISIAPGRMFTTGDHFNHCFRLNASFEWNDRFEEAIKTLAKLIRGLAATG